MEYEATSFFVRMAPSKLRQVARTLRGRTAEDGRGLLTFIPRRSARLIRKTLESAIANAENNFSVPSESLKIENVLVGNGSALRRHVPAARGSAHPIRKRSSHIRVILTNK
jgi:large subunit ribosomal protein L22